MKHSAATDKLARRRFLQQMVAIRTVRFTRSNVFFSPAVRAQASKTLFFSLPYSSRLHNYCFLTSRSRGILREFGLSRFTFKHLVGLRYVVGVKRSSW